MDKFGFKKWLKRNKNYTKRTICDKISRVKRVERMFGVDIDTIKNEKQHLRLIKMIDCETRGKVKENIDLILCKSQLKNSLKIYRKYLKNK